MDGYIGVKFASYMPSYAPICFVIVLILLHIGEHVQCPVILGPILPLIFKASALFFGALSFGMKRNSKKIRWNRVKKPPRHQKNEWKSAPGLATLLNFWVLQSTCPQHKGPWGVCVEFLGLLRWKRYKFFSQPICWRSVNWAIELLSTLTIAEP